MDDQLRRRSVGAPAARSLLLTILGEYVLPLGEAVWQETLVAALVSVGYTQQAARQALARSVRHGWASTSRHGRRARVSLSDSTAELLRTGAERIYSFGQPRQWDGRWLVVVLRVPEERRSVRHQLRNPPGLGGARLDGRRRAADAPRRAREPSSARSCWRRRQRKPPRSWLRSGRWGVLRRSLPRPPVGSRLRCGTGTRRSSKTSLRFDPRRRSRSSVCRRCTCTPGGRSRSSTPTCQASYCPKAGRAGKRTSCSRGVILGGRGRHGRTSKSSRAAGVASRVGRSVACAWLGSDRLGRKSQ